MNKATEKFRWIFYCSFFDDFVMNNLPISEIYFTVADIVLWSPDGSLYVIVCNNKADVYSVEVSIPVQKY